jgi:hypothetical protein
MECQCDLRIMGDDFNVVVGSVFADHLNWYGSGDNLRAGVYQRVNRGAVHRRVDGHGDGGDWIAATRKHLAYANRSAGALGFSDDAHLFVVGGNGQSSGAIREHIEFQRHGTRELDCDGDVGIFPHVVDVVDGTFFADDVNWDGGGDDLRAGLRQRFECGPVYRGGKHNVDGRDRLPAAGKCLLHNSTGLAEWIQLSGHDHCIAHADSEYGSK